MKNQENLNQNELKNELQSNEPQQAQNEQTQQNLNEQNLQKALTQKELQNHIKDKLYKTKQENLLTFLSKHYPEAFSENHINLDSLKRILGLETQARGYELNFTGKPLANALYTRACDKELRFDFSFSPYDSKTNHTKPHTIIRGDNLDALKILKQAYSNKIKMIYIDPPYNTKNENFIYPDDFRKDFKEILKETGLLEIVINDKGEEEERESEHLKFFRNITGSKSHSGWLSFMLPRLKLARDLLKEDGVIFISIDDNEQANLKLLCDEIFGEENFVSNLCVVDNLKGNNNTDGISQTNEYCLIYAKDKASCYFGDLLVGDNEELEKWNIDEFGYWKEGRNIKGTGENAPRERRPSMFYPIYLNDNLEISLQKSDEFYIEVLPLTNGQEMCWNWGKEFLEKNKHELIVKRTEKGFNFIKKQRPALGDLPSKKMKTTCYSPKYSTSVSSNTIKDLFNNERVFNYTKSVYFIKDLLKISTTAGGGGGGTLIA